MRILAALALGLFAVSCGGGDPLPDGGADTWTSYAESFAATYCVSCHAPGGSGYRNGELDFRTLDDVTTNAAEIRCGVAPTQLTGCTGTPAPSQFPIAAPYPSDAERNRFVAWIEAGTP